MKCSEINPPLVEILPLNTEMLFLRGAMLNEKSCFKMTSVAFNNLLINTVLPVQ